MTDCHCHILYGVDDGAQTERESKRMLSAAQAIGIDHIIATPHVKRLPYDYELTSARCNEVALLAKACGIRLELGFEVHWNALSAMEASDYEAYCFQGTDTLLMEFSMGADELPEQHDQMIYRLQRAGHTIIIAHPERYRFVQKDRSHIERWRDLGCRLQLDANCLLYGYEPKSRPTARRLFAKGVYDYMASDAHCPEDYERFGKAIQWAKRHRYGLTAR